MKAGLREISELNGVWGCFVSDNRGDLIMNLTPPDLKKPILENISRQILELMVAAGDHIKELSEIVFHYSQKKLFVIDLEKAILVVVCTPSVDISLLRMTINVTRSAWEDDPKVQSQLQKQYQERL